MNMNSKVVELKSQYLPTLHSDLFNFVNGLLQIE